MKPDNTELKSLQKEASFLTKLLSIFSSKNELYKKQFKYVLFYFLINNMQGGQ